MFFLPGKRQAAPAQWRSCAHAYIPAHHSYLSSKSTWSANAAILCCAQRTLEDIMTSVSCHTRIATRVISKNAKGKVALHLWQTSLTSGRHPSPPADIPHLHHKSFYVSSLMQHTEPSSTAVLKSRTNPPHASACRHKEPPAYARQTATSQHAHFSTTSSLKTSVTSLAVPSCWVEASLPYTRHPKAPGTGACTYQSIASHSCRMCYQGQALMI